MLEVNLGGFFSEAFWYIAPTIVTLTTAIAGAINQWFKVESNGAKQAVAWGVAALLSVAAWGLKLITFTQPVWVGIVALSVVTGLSSNGFYDIEVIKKFVKTWFPDKVTVQKS